MANSFFQFKKFTIHQEFCAMKITTDACLFGAWNAEKISQKTKFILDIGTGTGLLCLMIAQKNKDAIFDAVEISKLAATQAACNFCASPWKENFQIHPTSIQNYNIPNRKLYNLIISNPPFFDKDLKSSNTERNIALHSEALSLEELLQAIKNNLSKDGKFSVLLPFHRSVNFEGMAKKENYFLEEKVCIKQTPHHNCFRTILLFSQHSIPTIQKEIIIKNEFNNYTPTFMELLKDYYLYL